MVNVLFPLVCSPFSHFSRTGVRGVEAKVAAKRQLPEPRDAAEEAAK